LGICSLHHFDQLDKSIEIGGTLFPRFWGQIIMQNAFNELLDVAKMILETVHDDKKGINFGESDMLSQNDIAALAFKAYTKPVKIIYLPDWIRRFILYRVCTFTSSKTYGPFEFFMSTIVMDMQTPRYEKHRIEDFFNASLSN
jgi:hypothetical protein